MMKNEKLKTLSPLKKLDSVMVGSKNSVFSFPTQCI